MQSNQISASYRRGVRGGSVQGREEKKMLSIKEESAWQCELQEHLESTELCEAMINNT